MRTLHIDIETYSSIDLMESGVYKYVESPDFEILIFGYAFDDEDIKEIDLANFETLPLDVLMALTNKAVLKTAFNANFERACIAKYFNILCDPNQWGCVMVRAASLGLPMSLAQVALALGFEESKQKDKQGKALIQYFSKPCKPTKSNGGRTRNYPHHDRDKWNLFLGYCKQDVEVEREISKEIEKYGPWNPNEKKLWALDQKINDNGILLDLDMIDTILNYGDINQYELMEEAKGVSGLDNPNSPTQIKAWFSEHEGVEVTSLAKDKVIELLQSDISSRAKRLLRLRQQMAKTSIKKYDAMRRSACADGKIRGILQFYGANRTGRWAGRLVQVHNLPQNKLKDIDYARELVKANDFTTLDLLFPGTNFVLSQLVRTAFIAENNFVVVDFSAIEARVIAWYANEEWRNKVFATHGKIYEASASQMFKVPLEKVTKELRAKGKVAELALGYQGSVGALKQMGALEMGLTEEELPKLVKQWRNANINIVMLWREIEEVAIECVMTRKTLRGPKGLTFYMKDRVLFIQLPSGRSLAYYNAQLKEGTYGKQIHYSGLNQETKKWSSLNTYGGKLVENIVQATARDCLAESLMKVANMDIKFHVHDEIIIESNDPEVLLKNVLVEMAESLEWAPDLKLQGDGFITPYYKKD
ncbi:MAG: DNA polymerase [Breznakia sp.]